MVFLQVLTRTFNGRPTMLRQNLGSLLAQTDQDWVQTLIVDHERRGISWANANLRTVEPCGRYVWVLDDDDECAWPGFVAGLKEIVEEEGPDAIFVRMDHGAELGVLPRGDLWGAAPVCGGIGVSACIVRRDVFVAVREAWGERYEGDFDYIRAVWESGARVYWWDVVASRTQRGRMLGAGE